MVKSCEISRGFLSVYLELYSLPLSHLFPHFFFFFLRISSNFAFPPSLVGPGIGSESLGVSVVVVLFLQVEKKCCLENLVPFDVFCTYSLLLWTLQAINRTTRQSTCLISTASFLVSFQLTTFPLKCNPCPPPLHPRKASKNDVHTFYCKDVFIKKVGRKEKQTPSWVYVDYCWLKASF